jgi:hypothetical protein
MNDEKNAVSQQESNSILEPSSAINDTELNGVVGGFSSEVTFAHDKKIIFVVPKNGTSSDDFFFQASIEAKHYSYINDGYKILYATTAQKGHQVE